MFNRLNTLLGRKHKSLAEIVGTYQGTCKILCHLHLFGTITLHSIYPCTDRSDRNILCILQKKYAQIDQKNKKLYIITKSKSLNFVAIMFTSQFANTIVVTAEVSIPNLTAVVIDHRPFAITSSIPRLQFTPNIKFNVNCHSYFV